MASIPAPMAARLSFPGNIKPNLLTTRNIPMTASREKEALARYQEAFR